MRDYIVRLELDNYRFFVREYLIKVLDADAGDQTAVANLVESK